MTERAEHQAALIHGEPVLADRAGALVVPDQAALIVSDLHFEKGSSFAPGGQLLPPYDTRTTLRRLAEIIAAHRPETLIALGDSFHDLRAGGRMDAADRETLAALVASVDRWVWIEGNHDPAPPPDFGGEVHETLALGRLVLRHEPTEGSAPGEIAGHLHPCAKVRNRGRSVRVRCFATDGTRLVMPAFGAFTGGLNVCDPAFAAVFGRVPDVYAMGRSRIYSVSGRRLVPDGAQRRASA